MSPTLLAHLRRIERQIRADVAYCRADGQHGVSVATFYRPYELVRMYSFNRPRLMGGWPTPEGRIS